MSLNISNLAKRLFRKFTTKKASGVPNPLRFRPRLEACEDRTVPTLLSDLPLEQNPNDTGAPDLAVALSFTQLTEQSVSDGTSQGLVLILPTGTAPESEVGLPSAPSFDEETGLPDGSVPVVADAPAKGEWKQVSGPKIGVATETVHSDSKVHDVELKRPHPSFPNDRSQDRTESYQLRETITVKQGWMAFSPDDAGETFLWGTFAIPETVNIGFGVEESKTTGLDVGLTFGPSITIGNRVIQVGFTIQGSVVRTSSKTETKFLYSEGAIAIDEKNELMKGKDVKVIKLVPFYEVTRTFELVSVNGVNAKTVMEEAGYPKGAEAQKELLIRRGTIVAKEAGFAPSVTRYVSVGSPRAAIFTRDPIKQPE
jgi:hypothetical protein